MNNKITLPSVSILNPQFRWIPSVSTDVMATWIKHGYKPKGISHYEKSSDDIGTGNGYNVGIGAASANDSRGAVPTP